MAWVEQKSQVCKNCHTRQAEWDADLDAYIAQTSRCSGCERLEQEQNNIPKDAKGVKIWLAPKRWALEQPIPETPEPGGAFL